jgi:sugar diacid utilization regulator
MNITFKTLSEALSSFDPVVRQKRDNDSVIESFVFFEKNQGHFEENIIYTGTVTNLSNKLPDGMYVHFLILGEGELPPYFNDSPFISYIHIPDASNAPKVYNELQQIFMYNESISSVKSRLVQALAQGSGLQAILDIGYELFSCPMYLVDKGYKLLAYTKNVLFDNPIWNEMTQQGYFSNETVSDFRMHSSKRNFKVKSPVLIKNTGSNTPVILSNIIANRTNIGILVIFQDSIELEKLDFELISYFTDIISAEMQKNSFYKDTRGMIYEFFLIDILEGRIKDTLEVETRLKYLDYNLKDNIFILTLKTSERKNMKTPLGYFRDRVETILSSGKPVIYNNNIIVFISTTDKEPFTRFQLSKLMEFLDMNQLLAGISRRFCDIKDIPEHYRQSLKAIDFGSRINAKNRLFYYEDYALEHMMSICSSKEDLKTFCHASVLELIEYDRKNHTDYTHLLHTYLSNDKRILETAENLGIHRNTVKHKLYRIEEITGINMNNQDTLLRLLFSFKILEYLNE